MMTFVGLVPLILVNLAIVAVITPFATYRRLNAGSVAATLALVTSFVGTVSSVGPALVLAQAGDQVTITVLDVGGQESTQTMQTFTDARIPLNPPGT